MRKTGFEERLRTALLESGLTQARLAIRLNVTQATVSRWLAGKFFANPESPVGLGGHTRCGGAMAC